MMNLLLSSRLAVLLLFTTRVAHGRLRGDAVERLLQGVGQTCAEPVVSDDRCPSDFGGPRPFCTPFRSPESCPLETSFSNLVARRTKFIQTGSIEEEGWWFHRLEDKVAAYAFAVSSGFASPQMYYCGALTSEVIEGLPSTSFVIRGTGLHSSKGVYVFPDGLDGGVEAHRGIAMTLADILTDLQTLEGFQGSVIIEEFIAGPEGNLPMEFKFHVFNGKISSINVVVNRGTPCGCWLEMDEQFNRLDQYGCFTSAGNDDTYAVGTCYSIDFIEGSFRPHPMKGFDLCSAVPSIDPCAWRNMLEVVGQASSLIGAYVRIDMFLGGNGLAYIQEFTTNHMNGLRHCSAMLRPDGCIDACYQGLMWRNAGGNETLGGPLKPLPPSSSFIDFLALETNEEKCQVAQGFTAPVAELPSCDPAPSSILEADFSRASPTNPVLLDYAYDASDTIVEATVPTGFDIFVAPAGGTFAPAGSSCPPPGATSVPPQSTGNVTSIPLNGENVIVYVCSAGQIVGRCVYVFSSFEGYTPVDFSEAGIDGDGINFVSLAFMTGTPNQLNFAGVSGCGGYVGPCFLYVLSGDGGLIGGAGAAAGASCSSQLNATLIPNSIGFTLVPFTEDTIIYACENGVILVAQSILLLDGTTLDADFSLASPTNPIFLDYGYDAVNTIVDVTIPTGYDVFIAPADGTLASAGSSCPPPGATSVPPPPTGSFTSIPLNGEDIVVYVCSSGQVVGRCVYEFSAAPSSEPVISEPTTALPTAAPSSHAPSVSTSPSTSFPTVSRETLNEVITCIAVIDESCGSSSLTRNQNLWARFRQDYPDRPFCLLQPQPSTVCTDLFIPQAYSDDNNTIFSAVNRDGRIEASRSDWFDICNLDGLKEQGVTDVAIFIDNSGSLRTRDVQASYDFLLARMNSEGLRLVDGIQNGAEDWISPFLTDFM